MRDYDLEPARPPKRVAIHEPIKTAKEGSKRKNTEDVEQTLTRERYMGADQSQSNFSAKKKRKRTTDKKFNFEWNAEEDTSIDYNPIYSQQVEAGFFGRGNLGGLDAEEKSREYARALREQGGDDARAREYLELERQRKEGNRRAMLDRHWTEKRLEDMRERVWRIFKEDFNISTKGGSIPNPMRDWNESGLPPRLLQLVEQVGYQEPTAVQRACIPIALQNRDLIGIAKTGSGKTAAFLLPLLVYIERMDPLSDMNRYGHLTPNSSLIYILTTYTDKTAPTP
jgi:ATP-dependent RNA helicase DDX23/PRP28